MVLTNISLGLTNILILTTDYLLNYYRKLRFKVHLNYNPPKFNIPPFHLSRVDLYFSLQLNSECFPAL
jgi:hypothetical protein